MSQLKFYKYSTWALLIINVAVLSFFLLSKPPPRGGGPGRGPGGGPGGRAHGLETEAVQILQLDDEQQTTFLELAKNHGKELRSIAKQERDQLRIYFDQLIKDTGSSDNAAILEQVKLLEEEKVTVTFEHFESIQALLREDQQVHFERFMKKALQILLVQ